MSRRLMLLLLGLVVASWRSTAALGSECGPGCTDEARACIATARVERAACLATCTEAPVAADAITCRRACRSDYRDGKRACLGDLARCALGCGVPGDGIPCGLACASDLSTCARDLATRVRDCARGCVSDPDRGACLEACAAAASGGPADCRAAFTGCLGACAPLRPQAADGTTIGTDPSDVIQVQGPPSVVRANRGQTVYLDFRIRNNGSESAALRYAPSFAVVRGAGATIRSVSGKPSSPTSPQIVSRGGSKLLRVSVKIDGQAPGGEVVVRGTFAFTTPAVATVTVDGTIVVPPAARIGVACRNEFLDAKHIRVVVDVKNLYTETVKAVRISRAVVEKSGGGSFSVTSGRTPSVVYKLAPGATTQFSFRGGWNGRGVVRLFESATAATQLNLKLVSDTVECLPPLAAAP